MTELELTNAADADACAREELLGLVAHALLSHVEYHATQYGSTPDPVAFYGAHRPFASHRGP